MIRLMLVDILILRCGVVHPNLGLDTKVAACARTKSVDFDVLPVDERSKRQENLYI